MGLSQLYQIRGRVGRSSRKAYAYFTFTRDKVLTEIAAKRLSAIREFTSFGSGFRIAMRDLQIRGAGSLLGHSQHGHMEAVGYDLYVKMLGQAIAAARGEAPPLTRATAWWTLPWTHSCRRNISRTLPGASRHTSALRPSRRRATPRTCSTN